ncbi:putative trehalose-phosphate phosphatase J [Camellia lanceoleosa]|uniref:Trehalose-phosphate phosphatase J n=1 Tax=Camellia lanceoleosa TaxID=1840588 RepID=A0ACC0J4T9_9ERIC|nr:putative trehalose-phosphate phosphatase J [Camellia lanceoleosa]
MVSLIEERDKMTKQNVVASDTKSAINMAITVAVAANSSLFTTAAQKPPVAPGSFFTISKRKLIQNLEINGTARINAWVDSMGASSPTHVKSTNSSSLRRPKFLDCHSER